MARKTESKPKGKDPLRLGKREGTKMTCEESLAIALNALRQWHDYNCGGEFTWEDCEPCQSMVHFNRELRSINVTSDNQRQTFNTRQENVSHMTQEKHMSESDRKRILAKLRGPRVWEVTDGVDGYMTPEKAQDPLHNEPGYREHTRLSYVRMNCLECGHQFTKGMGKNYLTEVKCPKCGSFDTEPVVT